MFSSIKILPACQNNEDNPVHNPKLTLSLSFSLYLVDGYRVIK